jgi:hypothetical protein
MKNFPSRAPLGMILGTVLGLFSIAPISILWHRSLPPVERFYLPQFIGSTLAQTPIGTIVSFFHGRRTARTYFVLMQSDRPVTRAGGLDSTRHLTVRFVETTPHIFGTWLQTQIYSGRELRELLQVPIALWVAAYFTLFFFGLSVDFARRKRAREGVALRGPELLSRRNFNRATKGDGFKLDVLD